MISGFGIAVAVVGLALMTMPISWSLVLFVVLAPFRTAMALSPPGMGGASVLVPHFFLIFFGLRVIRRLGHGPILAALLPPSAGFLLFLLVAYGLAGGIFYPRLMAGITDTIALQRHPDGGAAIVLVPLQTGGTYATQGIYALGGLFAFGASFAFFRTKGALEHLLTALIAVCTVNVALAILDLVTHATGTAQWLGFMRNASYAILTDSEKGGLKRIVGSFSEASAFAVFTLALFAVACSLWLDATVAKRRSLLLALALLALLLASTSGTAYVGLILVLTFLLLRHLARRLSGHRSVGLVPVLCVVLATAVISLAIVVLAPSATTEIGTFLNETVFDKAVSQSGQERSMWNATAFKNAVDTYGLGVGIGGARASSYALVLLSNVGVPGFLLYLAFIGRLLFATPSSALSPREGSIVRAAQAGIVGFLAGHVLVGTVFDQGPIFYALAGAVAASAFAPVSRAAPAGRMQPSAEGLAVLDVQHGSAR
ncbi:hypothetical protein N9H93_01800 [Rhizobiaceae bacterium]|nr:hypothetical protein [Rhizobiaceae bacterium]